MSDYTAYMWSVPDWRTDEMYLALDNREQGIYRNLIDECWVARSIVADPALLARFVREPLDYFIVLWEKLRPKFKSIDSGKRLISPRLEQDRRRLMHNAKFREIRARKAAETRWNKDRVEKELHATSIALASIEHGVEHHHVQGECSIPLPIHTANTERLPICIEPAPAEKRGGGTSNSKASQGRLLPLEEKPDKASKGRRVSKGRRSETAPPDEFGLTQPMWDWATAEGFSADQVRYETAKMLDHFRSKGERKYDWTATWRNWLRNSSKFAGGNGNGRQQESKAESIARKNRETADSVSAALRGTTGDDVRPTDRERQDGLVRTRTVGS